MGTYVVPYVRPIVIMNNGGFSKIHSLDEVGMYGIILLHTFREIVA